MDASNTASGNVTKGREFQVLTWTHKVHGHVGERHLEPLCSRVVRHTRLLPVNLASIRTARPSEQNIPLAVTSVVRTFSCMTPESPFSPPASVLCSRTSTHLYRFLHSFPERIGSGRDLLQLTFPLSTLFPRTSLPGRRCSERSVRAA